MEAFIPTRAAQIKKNAKILHSITTYEKPKKIIHSTQKNENTILKKYSIKGDNEEDKNIDDDTIDEKRKQEIEMKKYRYEVIKFGITGLKRTQVRQAKIALAISLGAKPPKNKNKNYKKLIEQRKIKKLQEKKEEKFSSGFNTKQLFKNKQIFNANRKEKKKSAILEDYGKVTEHKKQKQENREKNRRGKK